MAAMPHLAIPGLAPPGRAKSSQNSQASSCLAHPHLARTCPAGLASPCHTLSILNSLCPIMTVDRPGTAISDYMCYFLLCHAVIPHSNLRVSIYLPAVYGVYQGVYQYVGEHGNLADLIPIPDPSFPRSLSPWKQEAGIHTRQAEAVRRCPVADRSTSLSGFVRF